MLKILIFLVAGFFLYKMIMGDRGKKLADQKEKEKEVEESGEMVKDPVCGTYVSSDSAIRVKEGNQVYSFCSYECRDKFIQDRQNT